MSKPATTRGIWSSERMVADPSTSAANEEEDDEDDDGEERRRPLLDDDDDDEEKEDDELELEKELSEELRPGADLQWTEARVGEWESE